MKIACYSESLADQAALEVFAEALVGEPLEPLGLFLEARGVTQVFNTLEAVVRKVYFGTDATGLIVSVDCDDNPLHAGAHPSTAGAASDCRLCEIHRLINWALNPLIGKVPGRAPLKYAAGMAVPAIEGWYLIGDDPHVGEANLLTQVQSVSCAQIREKLKQKVYGTDRPTIEMETDFAIAEAKRIVSHPELMERLKDYFPVGFTPMAREIASWRRRPPEMAASGGSAS